MSIESTKKEEELTLKGQCQGKREGGKGGKKKKDDASEGILTEPDTHLYSHTKQQCKHRALYNSSVKGGGEVGSRCREDEEKGEDKRREE